jgi:hypothetical protein
LHQQGVAGLGGLLSGGVLKIFGKCGQMQKKTLRSGTRSSSKKEKTRSYAGFRMLLMFLG